MNLFDMKHNKFTIAVVLIAMVFLLLLFVRSIKKSGEDQSVASMGHHDPLGIRPPMPSKLVEDRLKLLEEMKQKDPNYDLKVPIEFFGRVLDQHDAPVAKAKIAINLSPPDDTGARDRTVFTETNGNFALMGFRGKYVSVDIYTPEGYTCGDVGYHGDYNYSDPGQFDFHVPDPNHPVIFRLWKYEHTEPMHRWVLASKVRTNGNVGWFDLKSGKVGNAGLGVSVMDHTSGKKNEVHVTYKIVCSEGCGVIETMDDPMFSAPENGFKKEIVHQLHWKDGESSKSDSGKFRFYYQGKDGKYAAVTTNIRFDSESICDVSIFIVKNPSGSRNLEYNPALEIKAN